MNLSWPEFVALTGRSGYQGMDIELDQVRADGIAATLALLAEHNLKPAVCGLPVEFRNDDAAFEEGMDDLDQYTRLAVELGCPRMATWVLPAYETPGPRMRKILQHRFTEIAKVLAGHNVRLGLEFITPLHFRQSGHVCEIWKMADMLALCHECGENVGLLLDSWHWHHDPDHTPRAIVDAGRDRIVTIHLNDSPDLPPDQIRDNQRLLPGEGIIDLTGFFGALKKIDYQDAITLEIFGRLDQLSPDEAAQQALVAAKKVMNEM
jgi:sugar phosphate isomerase/epimerase